MVYKSLMTLDDLAFDRRHIWHPYTSMTSPLPVYPVVSAHGCELSLAGGEQLVDGMSSWWAAIHGYNHPRLNAAMKAQIDQMSHVMFGGITHPSAVALCRQLVAMTPESLECVFLADSGSVAVEVAMKMALQYWQAKGQPRRRFLTFRNGYHGDTFGAMSVCDPQNSMHSLWQGYLPDNLFAPAPQSRFDGEWDELDMVPFARLMAAHRHDIAAVILEPIVQGAGGMRMYHPEWLRRVRKMCDREGILLIADEIATGFGRTGKLFACEHAGICLLYTSDAADELDGVDLGGRRIIKKKFFQAEDGIRDQPRSRGLGDVYKRQATASACCWRSTIRSMPNPISRSTDRPYTLSLIHI